MSENREIFLTDAFFALVNSEILVWNSLDAAFKRAGIPVSLGRFIPLYCLAQEPLRLQDLAARCHNRESATSRLVERMCQDGLVAKTPDARDRRSVMLHLTERGRQVEAEARVVFHEHLANVFAGCPHDQLRFVVTLFGKLSAAEEGIGS